MPIGVVLIIVFHELWSELEVNNAYVSFFHASNLIRTPSNKKTPFHEITNLTSIEVASEITGWVVAIRLVLDHFPFLQGARLGAAAAAIKL